MIVLGQGLWAKQTVKLAPEPPGERCGIAGPGGEPIRLVAVGDSLVAGSGVEDQSEGLVPRLAAKLSEAHEAPVAWETYSQLGATMRRVRYRFLPEVEGDADILLVCAGSNDVMARRTLAEWEDDLSFTLDSAQEKAKRVVLCSAGQPHNSPALPVRLRRAIEARVDEQTEVSRSLCEERDISFANVTHSPLPEGFWAGDGFHPSDVGYEETSRLIFNAMGRR